MKLPVLDIKSACTGNADCPGFSVRSPHPRIFIRLDSYYCYDFRVNISQRGCFICTTYSCLGCLSLETQDSSKRVLSLTWLVPEQYINGRVLGWYLTKAMCEKATEPKRTGGCVQSTGSANWRSCFKTEYALRFGEEGGVRPAIQPGGCADYGGYCMGCRGTMIVGRAFNAAAQKAILASGTAVGTAVNTVARPPPPIFPHTVLNHIPEWTAVRPRGSWPA